LFTFSTEETTKNSSDVVEVGLLAADEPLGAAVVAAAGFAAGFAADFVADLGGVAVADCAETAAEPNTNAADKTIQENFLALFIA
jgi:hypothetical protein